MSYATMGTYACTYDEYPRTRFRPYRDMRVHAVCAHVVAFTGISPLPEALMKVGQGQAAISALPRFLLFS